MPTKPVVFEAWAVEHAGELIKHGNPKVGPILVRSDYAARSLYPITMRGSCLPVRVRVTVEPIEGGE